MRDCSEVSEEDKKNGTLCQMPFRSVHVLISTQSIIIHEGAPPFIVSAVKPSPSFRPTYTTTEPIKD